MPCLALTFLGVHLKLLAAITGSKHLNLEPRLTWETTHFMVQSCSISTFYSYLLIKIILVLLKRGDWGPAILSQWPILEDVVRQELIDFDMVNLHPGCFFNNKRQTKQCWDSDRQHGQNMSNMSTIFWQKKNERIHPMASSSTPGQGRSCVQDVHRHHLCNDLQHKRNGCPVGCPCDLGHRRPNNLIDSTKWYNFYKHVTRLMFLSKNPLRSKKHVDSKITASKKPAPQNWFHLEVPVVSPSNNVPDYWALDQFSPDSTERHSKRFSNAETNRTWWCNAKPCNWRLYTSLYTLSLYIMLCTHVFHCHSITMTGSIRPHCTYWRLMFSAAKSGFGCWSILLMIHWYSPRVIPTNRWFILDISGWWFLESNWGNIQEMQRVSRVTW